MNDLNRLRTTLEQHADRVVDVDLAIRPGAVVRRAMVLRHRRRTARLAGAVVLTGSIATTLVVVASVGGPSPDISVAGQRAPATLTALGYTYELDRVVGGAEGVASLQVPTTEEPRLVTWATSGEDQEVTVQVEDDPPATHVAADFTDWVALDDDDDVPEAVTASVAEGRVGLAVYRLADPRPAGPAVSGVTFRDASAGYRLLDAVVGEPGETEVELTARGGERGADVRAVGVCVVGEATGERPPGASFSADGRRVPSTSSYGCLDHLPVAVGVAPGAAALPGYADGGQGADLALAPGARSVVRMDLRGGRRDAEGTDPRLRLVLALYGRDPSESEDPRVDPALAAFVERDGHLWRRATVEQASSGTLGGPVPGGRGAVLVRYVVPFAEGPEGAVLTVDGREESGESGSLLADGEARSLLVGPGAVVQLQGAGGGRFDVRRTGLATYVRAD